MKVSKFKKYRNVAVRRKWWIYIPFLLSALAGLTYALASPKVYEAQTLLLLRHQQAQEAFLGETDAADNEERFRRIVQMVKSPSNLEKLLETHQLYSETRESLTIEEKLALLANAIRTERVATKGNTPAGTSTFRIRFRGEEPEKVMEVTNTLAANLILDHLAMRESQTTGRSASLTAELDSVKRRLDEKENELKTYREKYASSPPEQRQVNLRILEELRVQLNKNQQKLRSAENKKIGILRQLGRAEKDVETAVNGVNSTSEEEKLQALKIELAALEAKYTRKHPDVIRLRAMIAGLEKKARSKAKAPSPQSESSLYNDVTFFKRKLSETEVEIKRLKDSAAKLRSQVRWYERKVAQTPSQAEELRTLNWEYENLKETYDSLLNKKLEAEVGRSKSHGPGGGRLRIVEPAKMPEMPVEPDLKRVILLALVLGLGLGCVLSLVRESVDTSYKMPEEVENDLHLPVMVSIPIRYTELELKRLRRKKVVIFFGVATGFVLLTVAIVFAFEGITETVNFVKTLLKKVSS